VTLPGSDYTATEPVWDATMSLSEFDALFLEWSRPSRERYTAQLVEDHLRARWDVPQVAMLDFPEEQRWEQANNDRVYTEECRSLRETCRDHPTSSKPYEPAGPDVKLQVQIPQWHMSHLQVPANLRLMLVCVF
jgi:hypothetical protein